MIVRHDYSPVVFLVVLVICLALFLGLVLSNSEMFNPTRTQQEVYARATQNAIAAEGTRAHLAATLTPQALAQEAMALPLRSTATHVSELARLEKEQIEATRVGMAEEAQMHQAEATATRAAMEREAERQQAEARVQRVQSFLPTLAAIAALILAGAIAYAVIASIRTRAREAEARALAERRRLLIVQQTLAQANAPVPANRAAPRPHGAANGGDGRIPTVTPPSHSSRPTA